MLRNKLTPMRLKNNTLSLAATDLANHLGCPHLTELNLAAAHGFDEPPSWFDPMLEVLQKRGYEHERAYLNHLIAHGKSLGRVGPVRKPNVEIDQTIPQPPVTQFDSLKEALDSGIDIIIQAHLGNFARASEVGWHGYADVLLRVDSQPDFNARSDLGDFHYEVVDTKLAKETKGGTILQLCLYSELLGELQGRMPERMYVVSPGKNFEAERFRVGDYLAYYRMVKARLEGAVITSSLPRTRESQLYPEPCEQCSICRWWKRCDDIRRADDHLTFVAGIAKSQIMELADHDVETLSSLADLEIRPLAWRPKRGSKDGIVRVREQARVQEEQRSTNLPVHEMFEPEPGQGLALLPEPSPGDMYFDLESARFVGEHGLQYLFGYAILENGDATTDPTGDLRYVEQWARDAPAERQAFEQFMDTVLRRWQAFPDLHVYHFGHYETSTLKQLASRYASREDELDRMLRAKLFVNLHAVVKQTLRAGVETYSIKSLEPFFGFEREIELQLASRSMHELERGLELDVALEAIPEEIRLTVRNYNKDDCLATRGLQAWLEDLRSESLAAGKSIERPEVKDGDPSEDAKERQLEIQALMERLLDGLPDDPSTRTPEEQARYLMVHMLEFHWRENKAVLWEKFRMRDLTNEDFLEERNAIAGLEFVADLPKPPRGRAPVHRYRYPRQDTRIREGDNLLSADAEEFGSILAVDEAARTIDVKKRMDRKDDHPTSVFEFTLYRTGTIASALFRMAEWVSENGLQADGPYRAPRDLLLRHKPRFKEGFRDPLRFEDESAMDASKRLALDLHDGILPIQGPPGTGKTHIGARMICELIRNGRTVGVIAHSHKVMDNLLSKLEEAGQEMGVDVRPAHKDEQDADENSFIKYVKKSDAALAGLRSSEFNVIAGTVWMWSIESFADAVDVLVVDEAGQMSLANVIAASQGASSVVLLGDPRQLDQPQKGSHPPGVMVSALDHLLDGAETMPKVRGLFLEETWRLSKPICDFTSNTFYQERLSPRPELENQNLRANPTGEPGLYLHPIAHNGNQSSSLEEVEGIAALVAKLTSPGSTWTDLNGVTKPLKLSDILIVAPYNAQVSDIAARIPGAVVGTVDRFQGQEAPVVIYSMTTSSREDAPRGMEFLYSLNRLNVATSRARCACILLANPAALEPDCRNPKQMRLANAFCRYVELAVTI